MIYGLYLSAQGAQIQSLRQDVISNNLANTSTNSFKREFVRAQSHPLFDAEHGQSRHMSQPLREMHGGVTPAGVVTDHSQGPLVQTRSSLDVALAGKGYLQVTDGKQTYLTRDGQLAITPQGQLVTREHGLSVTNAQGSPITGLDPNIAPTINSEGTVSQNGVDSGRLGIVAPAQSEDLQKTGKNLYRASGRVSPVNSDPQVKQGYVEASATQPVTEMMELIEASRGFEANINMIKYQDDALGRLLQSLPRH